MSETQGLPASAGRRNTRQRQAVAAFLDDEGTFVSAQQIYAGLREQGAAIGLATVYRTLQTMAEESSVDALRADDGEVVYRRCSSVQHHHHLVCRECGRTVEVAGPAVERWADAVAAEHGFRDISHTVELFGTCPDH